ncbi:uncharacterized protein WCC33_006447 [Rhinophrynus dorsalis]
MDSYTIQDCAFNQHCATLYQSGYPSSEGYSSLSPASSTDSCGHSPSYISCVTSQEAYGNIPAHTADLRVEPKYSTERKSKKIKGKLAYSQRQSASEREKLRMRNLSKALQNLRRYLPPSVAPADKTLTKIETLQLTIRYISHLSEQLGLTEEVLEQRRLSSIQRANRCQHGLSCCMGITHGLGTESAGESFKPVAAPTDQFTETRGLPDELGFQNIVSGCPVSYQMPHFSEPKTTPPQHQYPESNTTLVQPASHYYATSFQQLIHCEDYTDLAEIWRREQSQA